MATEKGPNCSNCGTSDFSNGEYRDWSDDPHYAYCLNCAASISDAQWVSPGDVIGGSAPLSPTATVAEKFMVFHSTEFWAMVWEGRAKFPLLEQRIRRTDESATEKRLDMVEQAMVCNDWETAFKLLQPVGAPRLGSKRKCSTVRIRT